jgi:uncharacterized protein YaaN involved in tellurite resistance
MAARVVKRYRARDGTMKKAKLKTPSGGDWSAVDLKKINDLASKIDLSDTDGILRFGVSAQRQISGFSDRVLSHVRAKDARHVRELLEALTRQLKRLNVSRLQEDSILAKVPILGTRMGVSDRFFTEYEKVSAEVERLSERLQEERTQLLRDIELFDKLYTQNLEQQKQVEIYVMAAELRLESLNTQTLPAMKNELQSSTNPMDEHRLQDFGQQIGRLQRKLDELKLTRSISIQNAGHIRMIQSGMQVLIEGIQSTTLNSVPLWRSQISIALSRARQKKTLRLQKEIGNAAIDMLRRSSSVLQSAGVETAESKKIVGAKPDVAAVSAPAATTARKLPAKPAPKTSRASKPKVKSKAAAHAATTATVEKTEPADRLPAKPVKSDKKPAVGGVSMRALHDGT